MTVIITSLQFSSETKVKEPSVIPMMSYKARDVLSLNLVSCCWKERKPSFSNCVRHWFLRWTFSLKFFSNPLCFLCFYHLPPLDTFIFCVNTQLVFDSWILGFWWWCSPSVTDLPFFYSAIVCVPINMFSMWNKKKTIKTPLCLLGTFHYVGCILSNTFFVWVTYFQTPCSFFPYIFCILFFPLF